MKPMESVIEGQQWLEAEGREVLLTGKLTVTNKDSDFTGLIKQVWC